MSFLRFQLDLAVKMPIPAALQSKIPAIRAAVQHLKQYASKINEGKSEEEMTVKATFHTCRHDTGEECSPEVDV